MEEKRQISEREKKHVLRRDHYSCRYCGTKKHPFEFDHVYPYSKGGETSINNIVTSCGACNRKKYNKIGVWPKPIGYFDKHTNSSSPSFLSFFFSIWAWMLWGFGIIIYFADPWWSFNVMIAGTIVAFVAVHTKRIGNGKLL